MKFWNGLKKRSNAAKAEMKEGKEVDLSFLASLDLDESFEDAFPGERPDEVREYDIHGREKNG